MVANSWMEGLKIYQMGMTEGMVVDWARNDLARTALNAKCHYTDKPFTHLLWLDADHTFNPDLALRLAGHMERDSNIDAISALYYARTGPTLPVVYVKDHSDDKYKHYPIVIVPKTLCEVDAFGFGGCLMKRDVFERVPEPWFTIDYRAGEDVAFCVRAREHGVRFFLDGAYLMGHIAPGEVIGEKHYQEHMDDNQPLYADKIKVNLGGNKNGGN
jgi:GT2 family glycosyltransferase